MNKKSIILPLMIGLLILFSQNILGTESTLKDTTIDYTSYREVVVGDVGVMYKIKITNTGEEEKTYELIPDLEIIKELGSYKFNPSDKITIDSDESETIYFYLTLDKKTPQRQEIPITINTDDSTTTIKLIARGIGIPKDEENTNNTLRTTLTVILIILIIIGLVLTLQKKEDKKKN